MYSLNFLKIIYFLIDWFMDHSQWHSGASPGSALRNCLWQGEGPQGMPAIEPGPYVFLLRLDSIVGQVFALYMANLGSNLQYHFWSLSNTSNEGHIGDRSVAQW